ncbi:hypothetical protein PVAP13_3NG248078, partial [Panicum virgatum]
ILFVARAALRKSLSRPHRAPLPEPFNHTRSVPTQPPPLPCFSSWPPPPPWALPPPGLLASAAAPCPSCAPPLPVLHPRASARPPAPAATLAPGRGCRPTGLATCRCRPSGRRTTPTPPSKTNLPGRCSSPAPPLLVPSRAFRAGTEQPRHRAPLHHGRRLRQATAPPPFFTSPVQPPLDHRRWAPARVSSALRARAPQRRRPCGPCAPLGVPLAVRSSPPMATAGHWPRPRAPSRVAAGRRGHALPWWSLVPAPAPKDGGAEMEDQGRRRGAGNRGTEEKNREEKEHGKEEEEEERRKKGTSSPASCSMERHTREHVAVRAHLRQASGLYDDIDDAALPALPRIV